MNLDIGRLFSAFNPDETLNWTEAEDQKYYIDFSSVRGSNIILEMKRTILYSKDRVGRERQTCQLFTGHIGCGKSTELSRFNWSASFSNKFSVNILLVTEPKRLIIFIGS